MQTGKRSLQGQNSVESIAKNAGHETLRLPPHHCELNPIEMVWGVLKNYVATENKDMTLKSVEELFRKRHAELKDQPEFWKKCVEKVKRIEKTTENQTFQLIFKLKSCVLNYILIAQVIQMNLNVCLAKHLTLRVNQPYY